MEGKNWSEFEECKCKVENRCNTFFVRLQEIIAQEKIKERTKNIKDIDNKLNEIEEHIEK